MSAQEKVFFTIGYEGLDPDSFMARLRRHGVEQLIDIRERASSRKKGFSKTPLSNRLAEEGMGYIHIRGAGAPPEIRNPRKETGDLRTFLDSYSKHLDDNPDAVEAVHEAAMVKPSVLMCFEADYRQCHRSMLSTRLASLGMRAEHI